MSRTETIAEGVTLYLGDCREILPTIGKVDALVTDPPYGISYGTHDRAWSKARTITNDHDGSAGQAAVDWAFANNVDVIAFANPRRPWDGRWRSWLCWDKGGAVGGGGDTAKCFKQSWELIQVFQKGALLGGRDQSVLRFPVRRDQVSLHPTQKPADLLKYLVGKIDAPTIADPFMGSGTTGVACISLGRKFVGIEIEQEYFDVACRRLEGECKTFDLLREEGCPVCFADCAGANPSMAYCPMRDADEWGDEKKKMPAPQEFREILADALEKYKPK